MKPDEVGRMIEHAQPGLYRSLLMMAALTGMRSGELLAVQWGDIEFDPEPRVHVRRTLSWARATGEEGSPKPRFFPPKTTSGARTIRLVPELVAALKRWKLQCPVSELGLVFPTPDGTPIRRSNALRYGLWPALARAELRRVTMHSLRHSFASALIMQGAPITEVQHLLGHASPTVTLKVYSHWFRDLCTDSLTGLSTAVFRAPADKRTASDTTGQTA